MKTLLFFLALSLMTFSTQVSAVELPAQPSEENHPGSPVYGFSVQEESINIQGRRVSVYLPRELMQTTSMVPAIVFGHGQAMGAEYYVETFRHLAGKGFAVVFPEYSNGFFDQNWRRMANDYQAQVAGVLERFAAIDATKLIYSGHSKGAYVASIAAGLPSSGVSPAAVILFNAAGFDRSAVGGMNNQVVLTVVWSESDTIVEESFSRNIFDSANVDRKQFILVKDYAATSPSLPADHFFIANKRGFFGGRDGISPFHYHGAWKWLIGAARDLINRSPASDPYAYGNEAAKTGLPNFSHELERNW